MSSFFERNKKKSLLAALLLLLRRGKGVVALLVLVVALSGLFVLPGGMRIPWASKEAGKLGFGRTAAQFNDMTSAIRSARESLMMESSMEAQRRKLAAVQAKNGDSSTSAYLDLRALPKYGKVAQAGSISGVVNPDQVTKKDNTVQLAQEEFMSGLVKSAEAGMMAAGGPMADGGSMADGGKMADAGQMAELSKGAAINPGEAVMDQALQFAKVPGSNGQQAVLPKGEKYDKLTGSKAKELGMKSYGVGRNLSQMYQPSPACQGDPAGCKPTFYKLAEARAYSVTAAPPTCLEPACPKEYAHTTAAIVFDGQQPGAQIMSAQELNENTSPVVPDADKIKGIVDESMKYYDDTQKCQAYEAWANDDPNGLTSDASKEYGLLQGSPGNVRTFTRVSTADDPVVQKGGTERELMQEMQHLSCAMSCSGTAAAAGNNECASWQGSMQDSELSGCGGGSCDQGACDKTKAQRCKRIGNRMRDVCNALEKIWKQKHKCPLAENTALDLHDCNQ